MKIAKFTLSFLLASQVAAAQPICQGLILDAMTEGKASVLKPDLNYAGFKLVKSSVITPGLTRKSPNFKKALAELIQMQSDTLYMSAGEKMSLEKGELNLAKRLDDETTLELSYQGDLRSDIPSFRLVKAAIVKGNAQSVNITKEPLVDSGTELKLKSFILQRNVDGSKTSIVPTDALNTIDPIKNVDDPLSAINSLIEKSSPTDRAVFNKINQDLKEVEIPVVIEGDLLKRFVVFADDLGLMDRSKVRNYLGNDRLNSLWALSKIYASYDFTKQVAKKQIYKYIMVGAAFYGVAMLLRDDVSDVVEKKVDELAIQSKMSKDDLMEIAALFSDLYQPWNDEYPTLSERVWNSLSLMGPIEKAETFKKFREDLGRALIKEYKNKGEVQFYFADEILKRVVDTNEKVISDLEGSMINKEHFVFINLPYTKKLFVGVLRYSGKKGKVESIAYTVVTKKEAPGLYDELQKMIQEGIQRANPVQPAKLLDK